MSKKNSLHRPGSDTSRRSAGARANFGDAPEVLPCASYLCPLKYTGAAKAFAFMCPQASPARCSRTGQSRSVFIDADRYVSEDSLGYGLRTNSGI